MNVYFFDAHEAFNKSLEELNILIDMSSQYETTKEENKRSLMLRSTILFLGTHLECFFESIAEEYIYKIEQLNLPRDKMPIKLLLSSVHFHFNESLISKVQNKKPECKNAILKLAHILDGPSPVTEIKVDTGFSYGKHGSNVVEQLFERLDACSQIFDECKVYAERETMFSDAPEKIEIDIKGKFNCLTSARNALIHQYKNPSEDTIKDIIQDVEIYKQFSSVVSAFLEKKIKEMAVNSDLNA